MQLYIFIVCGFIAQMIDGSLGMAYGVSSSTLLVSMGVSPKLASASVHTAEIFTTFISGILHWKFKNVDKKVLIKLIIPGMIGGFLGAYVLVNFPSNYITPIVSIYLILTGIRIIFKAIKDKDMSNSLLSGKKVSLLGWFGGFCDAIGGGGWGPIVTSTMVAAGHSPRHTIGTVNTAEFFVTVVQMFTFSVLIGITEYWKVIIGLALGGVIATPFAVILCKKIAPKKLMITVGILIVVLNIRNLLLVL